MKNKMFRMIPLAVAAAFVALVLSGGMEKLERRFGVKGGGIASLALEGEAQAQALASQPFSGSPAVAKLPCTGRGQAASGQLSVPNAPKCVSQFHDFGCMVVDTAVTPVPGNQCLALETAISTVINSVTVTPPGILVNLATNAGTPEVVWFGID